MLDHPVVEQRHPRFERECHAGPVRLGQNISRQVGAQIQKLHSLQLVFEPAIEPGRLQPTRAMSLPRDQLRIERPVRDEPGINLVEPIERHQLGQLVQLVSEQAGTPVCGQNIRQSIPDLRPERDQHAGRARLEQHLGVGVAAERGAGRFELRAQLPEVVDLPVVGDHQRTVRGHHRLVSARGKIDDGEAPVPERDSGIGVGPLARVVGTARLDE